ncbi:unnamed protein product [Parnassius apollo]|uniref:(apollo) hypothetical protein n=1 Tax=Parnassius apollo TaxID=110799 RepID=A0A8S3XSW9_PARAO|nr:unnamed protein product [Parnassius apollo]
MKSIQGLNIYQFPTNNNNNKVKACIIAKPKCGALLGITQFSSSNLCVVQITVGSKKLYIASAYIKPRRDELATLERVDAFLKATSDCHCILCGDFNGWHPLWGSDTSNPRGRDVAEIMFGNDMYICNTGSTPTFETVTHGRNRTSIIDLIFASGSIYENISRCQVNLEVCPLSQHNAVEMILNLYNTNLSNNNTSTYQYKSNKANWAEFISALDTHLCNSGCLDVNISTLGATELEDFITKTTDIIHETCRASMPVRKSSAEYKPLWWTDKLENYKKEVISLHHKIHQAKKRCLLLDQLIKERQEKKKEYAEELRRTSTNNFKEFCQRQNKENVWSLTNRLLKEIKRNRPPSTLQIGNTYTDNEEETSKALLNQFYPDDTPDSISRHEELRKDYNTFPNTDNDLPFSEEEILEHIQISTAAALALAQFTPLDLKIKEVHQLENIRSSGKTQYLPEDITFEAHTTSIPHTSSL